MKKYDWQLYPDAERYLNNCIQDFLDNQDFIKEFSDSLISVTSTNLFDWIDHLVLPASSDIEDELQTNGFEKRESREMEDDSMVYIHEDSTLFPVILTEEEKRIMFLKPENLDHLVQMLGKGHEIEGAEYSPYRRCILDQDGRWQIGAVERRGYNGYRVQDNANDIDRYRDAWRRFRLRGRHYVEEEDGMRDLHTMIDDILDDLRPARVADAFFRSERVYWQSRDWAGQVQKARQDTFGLGWGNHDHHTYRSSRSHFVSLISFLERIGMTPREQFFAGEEAGWGAQILEQPECDIVVFADIDISAAEKEIDFAHNMLEEKESLGTVGLWTAIHGESILGAGLHHLAARVDFDNARESLEDLKVDVMRPFSDFRFLKQAFTGAQRRNVDKTRLDSLLERNQIGERTYDNFSDNGAIGSHLEIIERRKGFKGFNQESVTAIIRATDPRDYDIRRA